MKLMMSPVVQLWFDVASSAGLETQLGSAYKNTLINYPKFHKMNNLCKLAWLAAVRLFDEQPHYGKWKNNERLGTVFFNAASSLASDAPHMRSIQPGAGQTPSPSVFVYTLPNILNGELAIYFGWHGYSNFYVGDLTEPAGLPAQIRLGFEAGFYDACLTGVIESGAGAGTHYASLALVEPTVADGMTDEEIIKRLFLTRN